MKPAIALRALVLLGSLLLLAACTHVEPWQRGVLARPEMALDPEPLQNLVRNHTYSSREAAGSTNAAGGGGGCGCY